MKINAGNGVGSAKIPTGREQKITVIGVLDYRCNRPTRFKIKSDASIQVGEQLIGAENFHHVPDVIRKRTFSPGELRKRRESKIGSGSDMLIASFVVPYETRISIRSQQLPLARETFLCGDFQSFIIARELRYAGYV